LLSTFDAEIWQPLDGGALVRWEGLSVDPQEHVHGLPPPQPLHGLDRHPGSEEVRCERVTEAVEVNAGLGHAGQTKAGSQPVDEVAPPGLSISIQKNRFIRLKRTLSDEGHKV
jgi:hypothetical protein